MERQTVVFTDVSESQFENGKPAKNPPKSGLNEAKSVKNLTRLKIVFGF
jgi:hypothetical protein